MTSNWWWSDPKRRLSRGSPTICAPQGSRCSDRTRRPRSSKGRRPSPRHCAPARGLTAELEAQALREIVAPTVARLAAEGMTYSGVLYAGLILTADGPKLIEYNARFGDPECQVLMMRLESDLLPLLLAIAEGRVADAPPPVFSDDVALTVVMAANGYPGTPEAGGVIDGIDAAEISGAKVFQAGTKLEDDQLVAAGGRVLAVSATGATVRDAQAAAYRAIDAIDFPTGVCRRDIGAREGVREAG